MIDGKNDSIYFIVISAVVILYEVEILGFMAKGATKESNSKQARGKRAEGRL